ncbi:MAG: (Fe-S)-binding protein, partial [Gemmatimonadetes bacterium]|nr:(Fe-S)-binding protein [Gemmatimonadota bacterium]
VCTDPHSFNTIKNEYPDVDFAEFADDPVMPFDYDEEWNADGEVGVFHWTQVVADLAHAGRLELRGDELDYTVTYHDPCHLIHGQRVAEAPRLLLGAIPGLNVVPLPESTRCCGSAGVYNLTHPRASEDMLRRKVFNVAETGAELVVTGNAGCMVQIARGLAETGSPVRVLHPVSLLRAAYELPPFLPR